LGYICGNLNFSRCPFVDCATVRGIINLRRADRREVNHYFKAINEGKLEVEKLKQMGEREEE
jgi:hypothetical protein